MSKDMKMIYENYRAGSLLEDQDLFEHYEYIEHALGFKPVLNESGGSHYTSEMKSQIMEEHVLCEGFFDGFNPLEAIKKYGKEVGQLFSTLYSVIKNPKYIPDFISSATRKIVNAWRDKLNKVITFLENKNMPTFAKGLRKVVGAIQTVKSMPTNWKKAVSITGLVVGVAYVFGKLKEYGLNIFGGANAEELTSQLTDKVVKAAENFLMKEFPALAAKLYGKMALAASTGFLGWMAGVVGAIKVVNFAKDALAPMFDRYKVLTKRRDDREKTARDGVLRFEDLENLQETFRKNLGVIK